MESYHWILIAIVTVGALWTLRKLGIIDSQTAIIGSITVLAGSILGQKFTKSDDTGETTDDPRDEPVDDIPVDDVIDSPDEIDQEVDDEMADSDDDTFDAARDVGG